MRKITQAIGFQLVGRLIGEWTLVECKIEDVVGEALNLKFPQSVLLWKTLGTEQKISMLRRLIVLSAMSKKDKDHFKLKLREASDLCEDRNIAAHNIFRPTEDKGKVEFFRFVYDVERIETTFTAWSQDQFSHKFEKSANLCIELENLEEKLGRSKSRGALTEALRAPLKILLFRASSI